MRAKWRDIGANFENDVAKDRNVLWIRALSFMISSKSMADRRYRREGMVIHTLYLRERRETPSFGGRSRYKYRSDVERNQFGVLVLSPERGVRAPPFGFAVRLTGCIHVARQASEKRRNSGWGW